MKRAGSQDLTSNCCHNNMTAAPAKNPFSPKQSQYYTWKPPAAGGASGNDVIGAGPNAGLTSEQVAAASKAGKLPATKSTFTPVTRLAGESDSDFATRIRNQTVSFSGGPNPVPTPDPSNPAGLTATRSGVNADAAAAAEGLSGGQGYDVNGGGVNREQPLTEDEVYKKMLKQSQGIIDKIQGGYDSEIKANTDAASVDAAKAQQDQSAMSAASGLIGSSAAIAGASKTASDSSAALAKENAPVVAARQTAVANALQTIASNAMTEYSTEFDQAQTTRKNAVDAITAMGNAEVNWDAFKNTPAYAQVVAQLGGDTNYADAIFTLSKPQGVVDPNLSKVIGNTYYQITKDPVTGKISQSSFELPYDVPKNWTFQKVGTNAAIVYDPNTYNPADPSTFKNVYIDPFTGQVTDGSGSSNDSNGADTAGGSAARNIQSLLPAAADGSPADMSQPLTSAISTYGVSALASALIQNEGGSPSGVQNNPGNIKYTGMDGQQDSGVKATDGGTFASYKTPEDGQKAVEGLIQNAASGQSDAYGASPTLAGFIGKYTNTAGTGAPDPAQYGLLANVSDFKPSDPIDSAASNYLNEYLYQGKTPSAASVGVSTRTGSGEIFNKIADRANALYTAATGQALPDLTRLAADKKIITANNVLANKLKVQEGTVTSNFGLSLENLDENNINQSIPIINAMADAFDNAMGDPDVAAYLAQNTTLQNEAASLIAVKNASGTTVYDKMEAAGLVPKNASADQQKEILKKLLQEAQNASNAIQLANAQTYSRIDPLQKDPANPLNNPSQFVSSLGYDYDAIKRDHPELSDQDIVKQLLESQ